MGGACGTYGWKRNAYEPLVRKPEKKRPLLRPRHGWEVNVKWILKKRGGLACTGLFRLRVETGGGLL
jgi:hypothetical protein